MTAIDWAPLTPQHYENGLDRGVLYPEEGFGVAWSGLVSVEESFVGGERESHYYEGRKRLDEVTASDFQATIGAYGYPIEFLPCIGHKSVIPGFVLTRQPRERFGFSYRTLLGDGVGHKIHLVYNATASPTKRGYLTRSNSRSPSDFAWKIDTVPVFSDTHKPAAHYAIDSTKADPTKFALLENMLYGWVQDEPTLLTPTEVFDILT